MSDSSGAGSSPALITASPRVTALILASAIFMEQVDSTAIATALPAMAADLGVPPLRLSTAITAYLLSLAVFIPISGAIADRLGSRTVFRLAILVFTLGSVFCSLSTDVWVLVASRVLQGAGGAMMVPVGRLVLIRSVPKSQFVAMMSWVLVPAMIGPLTGPLLGGYLSTYWSWRWIFYINVPLGLLGMVLTTLFIPQIREQDKQPFDLLGTALSGVALGCLLLLLESVRGERLPLAWTAGVLTAGLVAAAAYLRHARAHPSPVVDFRLLKIPTLYVASTAGFLFRMALGAVPFMLPLLLQLGFGLSAARSGTITFISAIGSVTMKASARPIFRRFGYRNTLVWNGLFCTLYIVACAALRPEWPVVLIYLVLLVGGTFRSLQFTAYGTIAYADIPPAKTGAAVGFHSIVQQFSVTLGVAASAGILSLTMNLAGHESPTLSDFTVTFLLIALISFATLPICLTLSKDAGAELSGHRAVPGRQPARGETEARLPS